MEDADYGCDGDGVGCRSDGLHVRPVGSLGLAIAVALGHACLCLSLGVMCATYRAHELLWEALCCWPGIPRPFSAIGAACRLGTTWLWLAGPATAVLLVLEARAIHRLARHGRLLPVALLSIGVTALLALGITSGVWALALPAEETTAGLLRQARLQRVAPEMREIPRTEEPEQRSRSDGLR
jgi:hypothetical protein